MALVNLSHKFAMQNNRDADRDPKCQAYFKTLWESERTQLHTGILNVVSNTIANNGEKQTVFFGFWFVCLLFWIYKDGQKPWMLPEIP